MPSDGVRWLPRAIAVLGVLTLLEATAIANDTDPDDVALEADNADEASEASEGYFASHPFRFTLGTGVEFSTGDFGGDSTTNIWYVPSSLKLEWDPIVVKLTVPWVYIDGDVVLVSDQPESVPVSLGSRNALGDIMLSTSYVQYPLFNWMPLFELTGKVKFGTADEKKGIGTGENDYSLQLDASKQFGRLTPYGAVGYTFIGDPSGFDLQNKLFAYGGLILELHDRIHVGVGYDWAQSAVAGTSDFHEVSPFATIELGRHVAIDPYAVIGLSSPAPDWGVGVQLRLIWERD